jgi:hypothetical protein
VWIFEPPKPRSQALLKKNCQMSVGATTWTVSGGIEDPAYSQAVRDRRELCEFNSAAQDPIDMGPSIHIYVSEEDFVDAGRITFFNPSDVQCVFLMESVKRWAVAGTMKDGSATMSFKFKRSNGEFFSRAVVRAFVYFCRWGIISSESCSRLDLNELYELAHMYLFEPLLKLLHSLIPTSVTFYPFVLMTSGFDSISKATFAYVDAALSDPGYPGGTFHSEESTCKILLLIADMMGFETLMLDALDLLYQYLKLAPSGRLFNDDYFIKKIIDNGIAKSIAGVVIFVSTEHGASQLTILLTLLKAIHSLPIWDAITVRCVQDYFRAMDSSWGCDSITPMIKVCLSESGRWLMVWFMRYGAENGVVEQFIERPIGDCLSAFTLCLRDAFDHSSIFLQGGEVHLDIVSHYPMQIDLLCGRCGLVFFFISQIENSIREMCARDVSSRMTKKTMGEVVCHGRVLQNMLHAFNSLGPYIPVEHVKPVRGILSLVMSAISRLSEAYDSDAGLHDTAGHILMEAMTTIAFVQTALRFEFLNMVARCVTYFVGALTDLYYKRLATFDNSTTRLDNESYCMIISGFLDLLLCCKLDPTFSMPDCTLSEASQPSSEVPMTPPSEIDDASMCDDFSDGAIDFIELHKLCHTIMPFIVDDSSSQAGNTTLRRKALRCISRLSSRMSELEKGALHKEVRDILVCDLSTTLIIFMGSFSCDLVSSSERIFFDKLNIIIDENSEILQSFDMQQEFIIFRSIVLNVIFNTFRVDLFGTGPSSRDVCKIAKVILFLMFF